MTHPDGYIVIGFNFSLEFHGRYAWIDELYIRDRFRGKGVGTAVLEWVNNLCREMRIVAVRLEVSRHNWMPNGRIDATDSATTNRPGGFAERLPYLVHLREACNDFTPPSLLVVEAAAVAAVCHRRYRGDHIL